MTDAMTPKRCNKCGVVYDNPAEAFHVDRSRRCGLQNRCKVCALAAWKAPERHARNLELAAIRRAKYREERRAYGRKYWHANKHKYKRTPEQMDTAGINNKRRVMAAKLEAARKLLKDN